MGPDYVGAMLDILSYRLHHGPLSSAEVEARLTGRKERKVAESPGNIAVIQVHGVIHNRARMVQDISEPGGTSAEMLESQVRAAMNSDDVKALVLDIDSPGGAVGGVPEAADAIRELRGGNKPIIAQINDLGASAAYWLASATDEIVANPSAQVGSIGVIAIHEEISRMIEHEGITESVITSAPYKGEGNPFEPLGEEARGQIQKVVDQYHSMFIAAVAEGRGAQRSVVDAEYGQGRAMIADDAKRAGMIDRIGTMRETLTRLGVRYDDKDKNRASARRPVALARKRLELETALHGQD